MKMEASRPKTFEILILTLILILVLLLILILVLLLIRFSSTPQTNFIQDAQNCLGGDPPTLNRVQH